MLRYFATIAVNWLEFAMRTDWYTNIIFFELSSFLMSPVWWELWIQVWNNM